ncbi:MAG TPA: hypothetical protein PKE53_03060 [Flavobacteriales bacterium]|nr:hypothetical protein [Flavobacteriales bacterium]
MKKYLLPLLFIALAAVAWWLWRSDQGTTITGPLSDFAIADTARVDRIFIADKEGRTADLRKGPDGRWTVNGEPANQFPVHTLLKTFRNVEVRTPVPKSAVANTLKFMSTSAIKVEIYTGDDEPEKIWWVGHGTPDHLGVYTILEKPGIGRSESPFVLGMSGFTGLINTRFHANLDDWRSTDLAIYPDMNNIASMQVEHPMEDSMGYIINYGGDRIMSLEDAQGRELPLDTVIVFDMLQHLRDAHFEYFERTYSKAVKDSILASVPRHVLTIITRDGRKQHLKFWKKDPYPGEQSMDFEPMTVDVDRMLSVKDDTALVVVQRYWFDRMVPYLGQVRQRPMTSAVRGPSTADR